MGDRENKITFSLMWRIILLVIGAFTIPFVLYWLKFTTLVIFIIGILYFILVCVYVDVSMLQSLRALVILAGRIDRHFPNQEPTATPPESHSVNELENLVVSFSRLCERIESEVSLLRNPEETIESQKSEKGFSPHSEKQTSVTEEVSNQGCSLDSQRADSQDLSRDEEPDEDTVILRAIRGRAVFHCRLSTGDPVVGQAVLMPERPKLSPSIHKLTGEQAWNAFLKAIDNVKHELETIVNYPELSPNEKGIIQFQILLLQDKAILEGIQQCVKDGMNLMDALDTTFAVVIAKLEKSKNTYIAKRAIDCRDLQQRIITHILHQVSEENPLFKAYGEIKDKIVMTQQIYPSEVIWLHKAGVKGILSLIGTPSSHAEILMQSFNIPSLSNPEPLSIQMLKNRTLLLDTKQKRLIVDPTEQDINEVLKQYPVDEAEVIKEPICLIDEDTATYVYATINNIDVEAPRAVQLGADGVGLFRSEMSFIGVNQLPTENELTASYTKLCKLFHDKPLVLRMLDLGSDKLNGILVEEREENPCMGNRSMRLLLKRPGIFRTQLRAMLRSIQNEDTTILFPMISGWYELEKIRMAIDRLIDEFIREGNTIVTSVKFGIMVEVPSVALRFEDYVNEFDTFNIGTNDLTQYTLAVDRNNQTVQEYYKPYHPSVLTLIQKVAALGNAASKKVCICGEMASDPKFIPILLGLGIRHFSVPYFMIPKIKDFIRSFSRDECRRFAEELLSCHSTEDIEDAIADFRENHPQFDKF